MCRRCMKTPTCWCCKARRLAVRAGRGPDKQDCLSARASNTGRAHSSCTGWTRPPGLVLMARHIDAQRRLSHAFAERQVHKRYQAVVWGLLAAQEGAWNEINLPIAADWERRPCSHRPAHGKPSLTRWRLLGHHPANGTSRIELEPVTGRTHQLRVHMAPSATPSWGCAVCTRRGADPWPPRLLLHASHLAFAHPSTGGCGGAGRAADFRKSAVSAQPASATSYTLLIAFKARAFSRTAGSAANASCSWPAPAAPNPATRP